MFMGSCHLSVCRRIFGTQKSINEGAWLRWRVLNLYEDMNKKTTRRRKGLTRMCRHGKNPVEVVLERL